MKKFENPLLQTTYVNIHGETMTLVLDKELNSWFSHNDCNDDFEPINETFYIKIDEELIKRSKTIQKALKRLGNTPIPKYVFNATEGLIFDNFIKTAAIITSEVKETRAALSLHILSQ